MSNNNKDNIEGIVERMHFFEELQKYLNPAFKEQIREPLTTRKTATTFDTFVAVSDILGELKTRIKQKGVNTFVSSHEILGIVREEFREMEDAVREDDLNNLEKELMDIIVGSIWGIVSIRKGLDW